MSPSTYVDLEKLMIRFPKARLRGTAVTQLQLSGTGAAFYGAASVDAHDLQRIWIRRGHKLRLEVILAVDRAPVDRDVERELERALVDATMWKQLGLVASVDPLDGGVRPKGASYIGLMLQVSRCEDERRAPSLYGLCYRTPSADLVPPSRVDAASLDVVKLTLTLVKQRPAAPARKKRKTDMDMLLQSSEDEGRLLTPPGINPSVVEGLLAMVDAGLRLSLQGELKGSKVKPLVEGVKAKFLEKPVSLGEIAPSLLCRRYLPAMSTRAALLPTIAHALSGYIYTNAPSQSLKMKLRKFLLFGSDDAEGDTDDDWEKHQEENMAQSKRFEIMSAGLWRVLQTQILKSTSMPKLERLQLVESRSHLEEHDHDEHLFSSQTSEDRAFDAMFDDSEEEDTEQELQCSDEDDLLFDRPDGRCDEVEDEDLFDGDVGASHLSSDLLSSFSTFQDGCEMDAEDKDELLLDMMLDDGCYGE